MKIIVSGGAGFIGSHLCERLLQEGHKVLVLDNFVTGDKRNTNFIIDYKNYAFLDHDICLPINNDLSSFDAIYHLASPASPVDYKQIPLQTLWVNAAGTKNMLDLAVQNDMKILIASTSEIYGDPLVHPQKETYFGNVNTLGERSCYDEGKRYAESLAVNYHKQFGIPVKIARIFNTYGPRMRKNDGRVIPEFISNALKSTAVIINGDGSQTRSFCYVDDMVNGLIALMNTDDSVRGPVNIGNPEEVTIKALAEKIISMTSSLSRVEFTKKLEDDPLQRCPDIALAKKILNFEPKISLDKGLKKTINYFRMLTKNL